MVDATREGREIQSNLHPVWVEHIWLRSGRSVAQVIPLNTDKGDTVNEP